LRQQNNSSIGGGRAEGGNDKTSEAADGDEARIGMASARSATLEKTVQA
jgi:hypothetical protein